MLPSVLNFFKLHDVSAKALAEERRRTERRQRHLQDDLRYALKKVSTIDINATYEDVRMNWNSTLLST